MGTADTHWVGEAEAATGGASTAPNVLVAGEGDYVSRLSEVLGQDGYSVTRVRDGWAALDHMRSSPVDLALLDRELTGIDGTDVCRLVKRDHGTRLVPVMLLVSDATLEERLEGIEAGVDDLVTTPINVRELTARVRSLVRFKRYTDDFELAASVMTTLATMIEARDRYREGHCHRMANHAAALGRRIGLSAEEVHVLRRGAFLHDIGMLAIPDAVLLKPGALDAKEMELMRSHTVIGEALISNLRSLQPVRGIVRHHHERCDGSGYPDGLHGDEIPLSAQIVGLVDAFEAMTSPRPYQKTKSRKEALSQLKRQAQRGWHRLDLVEGLANIIVGG